MYEQTVRNIKKPKETRRGARPAASESPSGTRKYQVRMRGQRMRKTASESAQAASSSWIVHASTASRERQISETCQTAKRSATTATITAGGGHERGAAATPHSRH